MTKKSKSGPLKPESTPVNLSMLTLLQSEISSRFERADSKSDSLSHRLDHKTSELKADVHEIAAAVAQVLFVNEQQNAKSGIVFEACSDLREKNANLEVRIQQIERRLGI